MNKNKNILITGSSKGIGLAIAKVLNTKNNNVIITGRDKDRLFKVINEHKFSAFFAFDLTKENAPQELIQIIENTYGSIDILINNAGEYVYNPIEKTTEAEIERLFKLNSIAPYLLTRAVIPKMKEKKWGRIINIGSISGAVGEGNASLYSMTKSAFSGFTKALALELAQDNITVNTINPGWVDTELVNNDNLEDTFSKEEIIEMIPQRRFVHPDEVGNLCKYLISDNAKGLTGQSINLCAGLSIG
ncbi:MAG: SDR family NAD(P)-dependent oxidoreductase [Candidatus Gastranaerophilales bacterium]|nr:SDR family NAD(P)-dependent oxidoreductase [Candidatus Gastranaerophilales bacterium]